MKMDSVSSLVGGRLGNYWIVRQIGQGATAQVFLAEHLFLRRRTAVKILTCDFARWPDFDLEIFEETAVAAARLHHRNIVTLYDIDEIRARPYLMMEYVDGPSLHAHLRRSGPLAPSRALSILWAVASALAHAHAKGIVHCDIKPGNILIDRRGIAKVTDFGLAQALNHAERSPFEGIVAGTPTYISPEQILAQRPDQRSDLYSLGATLFEMLTGQYAFEGGSESEVCALHLEESRASVLRRLPARLGPLTDVLRRLISRYPRERYQSARDLLLDLRPLLREHPKPAPGAYDIHAALLRRARLRKGLPNAWLQK